MVWTAGEQAIYRSQLFEIPFSVALDHNKKTVVLSVRGTLSIQVMTKSSYVLLIPFCLLLCMCVHELDGTVIRYKLKCS